MTDTDTESGATLDLRDPFPGISEIDHEDLVELERWGQEQRRDGVRAVLDALPGPLRAVVRCRLPWVP